MMPPARRHWGRHRMGGADLDKPKIRRESLE